MHDFFNNLLRDLGSIHFLRKIVLTIAILFVAWMISTILQRLFTRSVHNRVTRKITLAPRVQTIVLIIRSLIRYIIYITAVIFILADVWKANMSSVLVGTAVLGTAIGFGSQGLIQDIINGLSLLMENQLNVGDFVEAGGKVGVVKDVGLRTVRIVGIDGMEHLIFTRSITNVSTWPNGQVTLNIELRLKNKDQLALAETAATQALQNLAAVETGILRAPEKIAEYAVSENSHILRWTCPINPLRMEDIKKAMIDNLTLLTQVEQFQTGDPPVKTSVTLS